jgi:hypothetical protein
MGALNEASHEKAPGRIHLPFSVSHFSIVIAGPFQHSVNREIAEGDQYSFEI